MSDIIGQASRLITSTVPGAIGNILTVFSKEIPASVEMPQSVSSAAKLFVRVAGVSGFLAVGLGAYGAHGRTLRWSLI